MSSKLHFTLLSELLTKPQEEHRWLVEGRLISGGTSILAGRPKAGKSTLARDLAVSISKGEPWLDHHTRQGPVLYFAMEEKESEVLRHFSEMGATTEPIYCYVGSAPDHAWDQLIEETKRVEPVLVIVDPLLRLIRVHDANDYAKVTLALDPLVKLARETDTHVCAVHHTNKNSEQSGGDAILGSTAIYGTFDTTLILSMTENERWLSSRRGQRYGDDMPDTKIAIDPQTHRVILKETRAESTEARIADDITAYLSCQKGEVLAADILSNVVGKKATLQQALSDLVTSGRVQRFGPGKRGNPYRYAVSGSSSPAPIGAEQETENPADPPYTLGSIVEDDIGPTWIKQLTPQAQDLFRQLGLPEDDNSDEDDDDLVC